MTDLETCWMPGTWSTFWFYELHSEPGQWKSLTRDWHYKFSNSPGWSSAQCTGAGTAQTEQCCTWPQRWLQNLILVLSPSTQLLQLISYHFCDRNPIISVLLAVTILEKSLRMIKADRKHRECLICLFLMILLHASFFQALWNSFSTLEDQETNGICRKLPDQHTRN